jgi:transposase
MEHYAAIDVSLEWSSVCVVDAAGQIVREAKVQSERAALVAFFAQSGLRFTRIGLEADPCRSGCTQGWPRPGCRRS